MKFNPKIVLSAVASVLLAGVGALDASVKTLATQHPDFDLDHVEPAGMLGRVVELKAPDHAARFGWWKCGVESGGGVSREVVEDALGFWKVEIDELAHAKGEVVSGAMIGDFTIRQERWASRKTKRLTVPLRRYS